MKSIHSLQTMLGLAIAKANGIKLGRPRVPRREVRKIRRLKREGFSIRELVSITDYSIGVIAKYTKGIK